MILHRANYHYNYKAEFLCKILFIIMFLLDFYFFFCLCSIVFFFFFFFQAEDGIRDLYVTGVQTCALPIFPGQVPRWIRGFEHAELTRTAGIAAPPRAPMYAADSFTGATGFDVGCEP